MSHKHDHRITPVVFISSTSEDLKAYRDKVREAVDRAKFSPDMMEYFGPSGHPPLGECMRRVAEADLLVVIVAHRYGWVPKDQPNAERKSITWLECEQAWQGGAKEGKEVLAFLVDEKHPWSEELKEEYRLTTALREGKATPELLHTVQDNVARLRAFKAWLNHNITREFFTTPEDLRGKVTEALLKRRIGPPPPPPPDPT